MLPSITGDCHPDINILCLPWADPGLCLSVVGHWGLQSHLLPSLLLDLGRNWQCIKSKFHATWGLWVKAQHEGALTPRASSGKTRRFSHS